MSTPYNNINLFTTDNNLFLITNSPSDNDVTEYIKLLNNNKIEVVIRLCEKTYNEDCIIKNKIDFIEMFIEDGLYPNDENIKTFFEICSKYKNIALHCKSGLGRAPIMVAIALIIIDKKLSIDTISIIRNKIKGAFNTTQLKFIKNELSQKKNLYKGNKNCQIM